MPDSQEPTLHIYGPSIDTLGPLAVRLSAQYGLVADAWQHLLVDDWLATISPNRWAHQSAGASLPRQNGKNAALEIREIFGSLGSGEAILHTAHEVKTAQKHFRRLKHFFGDRTNDPNATFPELNAEVRAIRNVNGQEAIFLHNGGSIEIAARSKSSARGFTVDTLVIDEAQELTEEALEALLPTISAAPKGNPQIIYTGTPPGPQASGEAFSRLRRSALWGHTPGLTWSEWSPASSDHKDQQYHVDLESIPLDDEELWRRVNPAMDSGRNSITLSTVRNERAQFSPDGFARERLGWWATTDSSRRLITPKEWEYTGISSREPLDSFQEEPYRTIGIAFSKDGSRVAVAGALHYRKAGHTHVEIIADRTGPVSTGVESLALWVQERTTRVSLVGISGRAGALALQQCLSELRNPKIPPKMTHLLTTQEYLAACSLLYTSIQSRSLSHPAGYTETDVLDRSVAVCDRKMRTADGGWGWEATTSDGDEVPLEAASIALWAGRKTRRRPGRQQTVLS